MGLYGNLTLFCSVCGAFEQLVLERELDMSWL